MRRVDLASFNLNLLLALDGLLREQSVTGAAKRVRVTPSAMSHSLAELRELLGDPLLIRSGRGMVLTPRAEALAGPLHALLKDTERLLQGGGVFDPATTVRRFVIAAPDFLAAMLLPPLLTAVAQTAPGVTLEIVPTMRRGNAWLLETGELDLALPAYHGEPAPRAIWTTPKGEIEIALHAGAAPLGMEELVRLTESGDIVGTAFTRVVPNFVAQQATIRGANRLRDEVSRLGLTRGNLSWASAGLDTGRPGYTLGNTPQPHNEGDFTALGIVIRGMDVVDRLELGDTITAARMVK